MLKKKSVREILILFSITGFFLYIYAGKEIDYALQQCGPFLNTYFFVLNGGTDQIFLLKIMHMYWLWIIHLFVILVILLYYYIHVHRYNNLLKEEISKRRIIEQKLDQYVAKLKHSNNMQELFIDVLRHDLINTACIIGSYTDLLMEIETDVKKLQYLKNISRSNQKLIGILEDAASFTKLDNLNNLKTEKMDLGDIISNAIGSLSVKISEKGAKVYFTCDRPYPAKVNEIVEQVFVNFLTNALKYGPQGGKIEINVVDAGDSWKICFADEGEGIPDEFKEAVFERFKRLETGAIKGSGLGLAIVKRIVELHGGQVGVTDNPNGNGSVFWVTFPKA